jgi:hypothetical protein
MSELVFQPIAKPLARRALKIRTQMIAKFLDDRAAWSPSGMTATLYINYCLANKIPFSVEYNPDAIATNYIVRLTEPK